MFTRTLPFPQPHVRSRGSWLNGSEFRHSTQRHRSNGHRKGEHRTGLPDPDHRVALQAHWVCVEVCFKVICGLPHRFCLSDGLRKFFYAFLASLHRFFSFPIFMVGTIYHVMRTISATITRTRIKLNTQIHPKLLFSTFCQPPRSSLIVVPKPGVSWCGFRVFPRSINELDWKGSSSHKERGKILALQGTITATLSGSELVHSSPCIERGVWSGIIMREPRVLIHIFCWDWSTKQSESQVSCTWEAEDCTVVQEDTNRTLCVFAFLWMVFGIYVHY